MKKGWRYLGLIGLFGAQLSFAADIDAGEELADKKCASCHGKEGISSIAGYPNLAGQNEEYFILSMKAYKDGSRTGAMARIMRGQAMVLSNEKIANLAAYYAQLK